MTCYKCGNEVPDESVFCNSCGANLQEGTQQPATENEMPVEESVVNEEVAPENTEETTVLTPEQAPQFAQVSFEETQPKNPKKVSKKLIGGVIGAVAAVVAVLVVVLNFTAIKGFFVKSFGSDEDYLEFVETEAFSGYAGDVSELYGSFLEYEDEIAMEAMVSVEVGDSLLALLNSSEGEGAPALDLDWINSTVFKIDVNGKDELCQIGAALDIDEKTIADLDLIVDTAKGKMFFTVLNLTEKYISVSAEDSGMSLNTIFFANPDMIPAEEIMEALPEEKELNKLLDKYIKIVFDCLDDADKSTKTVEINGIKQKLTVIKTDVSEKTLMKISKAVLKEVKKDKEIKEIITEVARILKKEGMVEKDMNVYELFVDSVDELIDQLPEYDEVSDEAMFTLVDYVNSKHEIVGREVLSGEESMFSYVTVRDGKKFATEVIAPSLAIKGEGTEKNDVVTGDFLFEVVENEILEISLKDFDFGKAKEGLLNGTIRIKPSSDFGKFLNFNELTSASLSMFNFSIELNFASVAKATAVDVNILNGDDVFLGVCFAVNEKDAKTVKLPSDKNIYDADEAEKWLESIDMKKLQKILADLPFADLIGDLDNITDLGDLFSGSSAEDDNYYGDDYYYNDDDYFGY